MFAINRNPNNGHINTLIDSIIAKTDEKTRGGARADDR